ncbi:hypothetical protein [Leptospira levettii]|uniref:hypothetical protein n=1 Tax=Leptospira levettii TaxID=2023178 RepID=UPI000C2A0D79|nr:hypothetical protein [Leptospira levettii]PJZ87111.1 hypothetical protein CH368_18460 [Leptospira levettii]
MLASLMSVSQTLLGYANVSYEYQGAQTWAWVEVIAEYDKHWIRDGWGNLICFEWIYSWGTYQCQCLVNGEWRTGQIDYTPWPWMAVSPDPAYAREYRPQPIPWIASGDVGYKSLTEWNSLQLDVTAGTKRNLMGTPVYG